MTIYIDMDDVVADFKAYATAVLKKVTTEEKWPYKEWVKLRNNPRLYRDLVPTAEAEAIVAYCRWVRDHHGIELMFLTAVPKGNDVHWAFYDKVLWAQKYFPDIPVMFGPFSKDKPVHCKPGDILIDDRTSNCQEWQRAGGIAIQHRGDLVKTIQSLATILDSQLL